MMLSYYQPSLELDVVRTHEEGDQKDDEDDDHCHYYNDHDNLWRTLSRHGHCKHNGGITSAEHLSNIQKPFKRYIIQLNFSPT